MADSVWRRRAPVALRIATGILLWPVVWFALAMLGRVLLQSLALEVPGWLASAGAVVAALLAWTIIRKAPLPVAIALAALALFALHWIWSVIVQVADALPGVE